MNGNCWKLPDIISWSISTDQLNDSFRNFQFGDSFECRLRSCFFFFVFHTNSGNTKSDWTGLSDISYKSPFNRDSDEIKT